MISFNFATDCYSCGACNNICPQNAIHFDELLFPVVNSDLCINCRRCEQVCINMQERKGGLLGTDVQGVVCKNRDFCERKLSSSGGIFILLAKEILARGGYVCGCVYDSNFMPKHILSNNIDDIYRMMGSKYVKSDIGYTIRSIREKIEKGISVLFSGVPCQTEAVRNCLGNHDNLFLVSVVCHGSIERDFWADYLGEAKKKGSIEKITMRDKGKSWDNYGMRISYKDGSEKVSYKNQDGYFLKCFTSGYFERDRCLKCKYKGSAISGDILLGDGWGMEQLFPDFTDSYGVSSVLLLTEKGKSLYTSIKQKVISKPVAVSEIVSRNQRIVTPAPNIPLRTVFQTKCRRQPEKIYDYCKEYARPSFMKRVINKVLYYFQ